MKKLALFAVAAVAALGASAGAAHADRGPATPLGYAGYNEDGYLVYAEGQNGLPVVDGYIGIDNNGGCHGAQTGDHTNAGSDPVCSAP